MYALGVGEDALAGRGRLVVHGLFQQPGQGDGKLVLLRPAKAGGGVGGVARQHHEPRVRPAQLPRGGEGWIRLHAYRHHAVAGDAHRQRGIYAYITRYTQYSQKTGLSCLDVAVLAGLVKV